MAEDSISILFVQHYAEKAAVDRQPAIAVINKTKLPELVHEMADARPISVLWRPFKYLAEVKAVNRTDDCHWEKLGMAEQRPEKKLPIIDSLFSNDSQKDNRLYSAHFEAGKHCRLDIVHLKHGQEPGNWQYITNLLGQT
jgi:hypothetical protein